jgi:hypothetical protein
MCQRCGCQEILRSGKEKTLARILDIVKELGVTPDNVDDYEATEAISAQIAPFGSREDDVFQTAVWISSLHEGLARSGRDERYQAHVRAFRDIFARLPVRGEPKRIATTYHQLEQLSRELDEPALASLTPEIRDVIQAVNHVHDNMPTKVARLKERYNL